MPERGSKSLVKREDVATPRQIRELVEGLTEREKVLLREEQERVSRLYTSRARLSRAERNRGRGLELEVHHRRTGNMDGLGEALAMQGRFEEASQVVEREDLKKEFTAKAKAVAKPDNDCDCDSFSDVNGVLIPNQNVVKYVWSEKHSKEMPLIYCSICQEYNVMPPPKHISDQKAAEQESANTGIEKKFSDVL
jgi:hypothetical protein